MLKRYKKCSESFNHKVVKKYLSLLETCLWWWYFIIILCTSTSQTRNTQNRNASCPFVKDITLKDWVFYAIFFQWQKDNTVSLKIPSQMSLPDLFWSSQGSGFICLLFFIVLFSRHLSNKLWLHFTGGNCSFWKKSKKLFVLFQLWSWSSVTLSPLVEIHTKQAFWEM